MRSGRAWYVCNSAGAFAPAMLTIYGEIGSGGVDAACLLNSLNGAREVDVRVNSEGGSVFEAFAVFNRLRRLDRVSVVVDGLAASAASVVCMAASPGCLGMAPHSRMMIHEANLTGGNMTAADLSAAAGMVDGLSDEIASVYAGRTGHPASYWREQMLAETWFSASQAVAAGLADYVESDDPVKAGMQAVLPVMVRNALRDRYGR